MQPVQRPYVGYVPPAGAPPTGRRGGGGGGVWLALFIVGGVLGVILLFSVLFLFSGSSTTGRRGGLGLVETVVRDNGSNNKVAVLPIVGVIGSAVRDASGRDLVHLVRDQLERISEDPAVRAVVLWVDSPGGEVLASDEIYRALWEFQEEHEIPVVAAMGSVAASGGYYVSAPCQWIVAHELTMTGSIGVIFQGYNYRELMDKVGVRPKVLKSGKLKDMWSASKSAEEETPEESEILQAMVMETYERFKRVIVEGRERAEELNTGEGRALSADWETLADGRVISGRTALGAGLVDELGTIDTAYARAMEIAGVENANVVTFEAPFSFMNFFRIASAAPAGRVQVDIGLPTFPTLPAGRLYYMSSLHLQP